MEWKITPHITENIFFYFTFCNIFFLSDVLTRNFTLPFVIGFSTLSLQGAMPEVLQLLVRPSMTIRTKCSIWFRLGSYGVHSRIVCLNLKLTEMPSWNAEMPNVNFLWIDSMVLQEKERPRVPTGIMFPDVRIFFN